MAKTSIELQAQAGQLATRLTEKREALTNALLAGDDTQALLDAIARLETEQSGLSAAIAISQAREQAERERVAAAVRAQAEKKAQDLYGKGIAKIQAIYDMAGKMAEALADVDALDREGQALAQAHHLPVRAIGADNVARLAARLNQTLVEAVWDPYTLQDPAVAPTLAKLQKTLPGFNQLY